MNRKITASMLLFAILASTAACDSSGGEETQTSAPDTQPQLEETTALFESDTLPELDFGGETLTILVADYGGYAGKSFYVEEP